MIDFSHITLPMYPIMMFTSFIVSGYVVYKILLKEKIKKEYIGYSLLLTLVSIITFSKELTILENIDKPLSFFQAGFSSLGGVIGLLISVIIFDWIYDKSNHIFLKSYMKVIPLLYSISKLGCFFVGCCHGFVYTDFLSIVYKEGTYFPVQLLESIVFFLIFLWIYKRDSFSLLILICGISKFILDYFRFGHIGLSLSLNQYLCIPFIVYGIVSLIYRKTYINS